jgi:hypothetical protein
MTEARFNPGDRAMLVRSTPYGRGETHIIPVKVAKVYANGNVILEGSVRQYRSNGTATKKEGKFTASPHLEPWNDAAWQDFQRRQVRDAAKAKLLQLSDRLAKIVRNDADEAAAIWESLPYAIRALIEEEGK